MRLEDDFYFFLPLIVFELVRGGGGGGCEDGAGDIAAFNRGPLRP